MRGCLWTALLLLPALMFAGDKQRKPTFVAASELVLVPAVVTDKSGAHVQGLTKDDFTILEEGTTQKTAFFEEVVTSKEVQSAAPRSATEFTNRTAPAENSGRPPQRVTIILFDLINTPILKNQSGRRAALKFLAEAAAKMEPTAIYSFGAKGVRVISDFTTDPAVLAAAIDRVGNSTPMAESRGLAAKPHENPTYTDEHAAQPPESESLQRGSSGSGGTEIARNAAALILLQLEEFITQVELNMSSMERRFAATYTLEAFQQIARRCSGIPGRKSLLWVTGGFPFDLSFPERATIPGGRSTLPAILPFYQRTWAVLNDAQIALYPIDVRGLTSTAAIPPDMAFQSRNYTQRVEWENRQTLNTLSTFAEATGGKAFYNSNNLKAGFTQAVQDSSQYYLLSYYRKSEVHERQGWRSITVRTRKGLNVRARDGYFVRPPEGDAKQTREREIAMALSSPLDFTGISLVARWLPAAAAQTPGMKRVPLELVMSNFAAVENGTANPMQLEVVVLPKLLNGEPVGKAIARALELNLTAENEVRFREHGLTYTNALELPPGQYNVRFVVLDSLSGRMGSLSAPLTVAP